MPDRNARLQELAAISRKVDTNVRQDASIGLIEKLSMGPERRGETIGNLTIGLQEPLFFKVQTSAERIEQVRRNLQVAFALAASQSDHGRYPANLNELSPKYLEKVPDDLFSGKALIYRLEEDGYLLYSVGPNGKDDGGISYEDQPPGDDIRVRIPVPVPAKDD